MHELLGKIGRFCENHVEKLVLVIVCLVCAWLFFTKVIFSPNGVAYDGKTFSPGQIDAYIQSKAEDLRAPLAGTGSGAQARTYTSKVSGPIDPNDPVVADVFLGRPKPQSFAELLQSPLAFMAADEKAMATTAVRRGPEQARYSLPRIGRVADVDVCYIRAAAYVPLEEVTSETQYDQVENEPNDIDLVTVEAKFDVAELYRQFQAHFAGTEVEKAAWRDPCLADPTFAAVQLQRQRQLDGGRWGEWTEVPRARVEANRQLFTVIEKVQDLPPGGVNVREMQFDNKLITMALLQPESYQIASAEEDWFPPSYYSKFKELQRKVEAEERRKEREEQRERQGTATTGRYRDNTTTTGGGTMRSRGGGRRRDVTGGTANQGAYGTAPGQRTRGSRGRTRLGQGTDPMMPGAPGTRRTRGGRRGGAMDPGYDTAAGGGAYGGYPGGPGAMQREPTTDEVYFEFAQDRINYMTDLSKEKDPVLFWALDDTAEPGGTYRYRIRLGVFNPVAGTNKLMPEDIEKKDQVILWSEFSDVTRTVAIAKRLYFFAKDVQEKQRTATVEVARYALGYWRTEDFRVQPGDVIGQEKEPEPEEENDRRSARLTGGRITGAAGRDMMAGGPYAAGGAYGAAGYGMPGGMYGMMQPRDETVPDVIDYRTHAVLVDLVPVSDWGPDLKPRVYHDMLYTADGVNIEHMPVSTKNWPKNLLSTYQEIMISKRKEQEAFRDFDAGGSRRGGGMGGMSPYGGGDMPYDPRGGAYPGMR
ncbi:MAG: hypothetical protein JSW27_08950 [Phycisphaerales bacterium]|nr:MAG: hypothetical protein JSW27_08950 [Phycisphaerales bacterium]